MGIKILEKSWTEPIYSPLLTWYTRPTATQTLFHPTINLLETEMTDTTVRFTLNNETCTGTLVAKRGLFWVIETEPGIQKNIPVKAIIKDEPEPESEPAATRMGPSNGHTAAALLAAAAKAREAAQESKEGSPKEKKEKKEADPNIVSLAALCTECKILGRIARRRLRKVYGTLPEGQRWEWKKDSPELAKIRALLSAKEDPADPAPEPAPAPGDSAPVDTPEEEGEPETSEE